MLTRRFDRWRWSSTLYGGAAGRSNGWAAVSYAAFRGFDSLTCDYAVYLLTMTSWNTTAPPRRTRKPVTLRYQNKSDGVRPRKGQFVWSGVENTWVQVTDHVDGIALYADDGWEVLGWL